MFEINYPNGSGPGLIYLGRNRYGNQAGIAVDDRSREGQKIMRLYPITTRGSVSDACHLEVPVEAVPALLKAIQALLPGEPGECPLAVVDHIAPRRDQLE